MRELEQRAYSYLGRDPILRMDMVEALRRGDGTVASVREDGVLVYVARSGVYLLAAENAQAGEALAQGIFRPSQAAVHDEGNARLVLDMLGLRGMMACYAGAYLEPEPPEAGEYEFHTLEEVHRRAVLEEFPEAFGEEELRERMRAGALQGLFEKNRLLGVIGLYPEGGLGYLTVKPEERGRGLEPALAAHMTGWCLEHCFAPFVHVPAEDEEMLEAYRQVGYTFHEQMIYWIS